MIHAHHRFLVVMLVISLFFITTGCKSRQRTKEAKHEANYGGKAPMRIGFKYPVVEVNGLKPLQGEDEIILLVPQDSTHDVTLKIADEKNTILTGKMQVFNLTEYNQGTKIIWISPDEAEYNFAEIVQQGYGEFNTYEIVGDQRGPLMVKLQVGIRQNR